MESVNHLHLHRVVVRAGVLLRYVYDPGTGQFLEELGFGENRAIRLDTSARQTPRLSKRARILKTASAVGRGASVRAGRA